MLCMMTFNPHVDGTTGCECLPGSGCCTCRGLDALQHSTASCQLPCLARVCITPHPLCVFLICCGLFCVLLQHPDIQPGHCLSFNFSHMHTSTCIAYTPWPCNETLTIYYMITLR
jgi:hypothetical protein